MLGIIKGVLVTSLFLIYPYLVYKGIENGMAWIAPTIFSIIYLLQAIRTKNVSLKIKKVLVAITLLLGAYYLQTLTAKILPVLIQLMLMIFFGRTLLKGNGPSFIERFVRLEFPEFPEYVSPYCRNLTLLWTGFFAMNVIVCSLLAIWGTNYGWTLYNGVLIYVMMGVLAVGEYIYRHFKFPEFVIPDMQTSMKNMIINGRKVWLDVHEK